MTNTTLTLLMTMALASVGVQADDWDKIKAKGEIVIGVRDSSPPFSFYDKNRSTVSGYDIDFARYITGKLGLKPVFKTVDPADRLPSLKEGRVDILIASLAKTRDREKEIEFSLGYFVSTHKLVARKGRFKDLLQLDQMTICVPKGSTNAGHLQEISQTVKIVQLPDYAEAFAAMKEGRCEAVSGPEATVQGNLSKMPNRGEFELADVPVASEALAVGIRKGEKTLQKQINDTLIEAETSGEAGRIFERWFGANSASPMPRTFKIVR